MRIKSNQNNSDWPKETAPFGGRKNQACFKLFYF